ncbi:MAG: poly-beta-1,6-N-acetyl-D-glucosamine biosynthesis protein PgaD [Bacillota bacterium]
MGPRQRRLRERRRPAAADLLIDGLQRPVIRLIEWLFTLLMWSALIIFFAQVVAVTLKIDSPLQWSIFAVGDYMLGIQVVTLAAGLLTGLILGYWALYNKRKYGPLRRRKFPSPVSDDEVARYLGLSLEQVEYLQTEPWVELESYLDLDRSQVPRRLIRRG